MTRQDFPHIGKAPRGKGPRTKKAARRRLARSTDAVAREQRAHRRTKDERRAPEPDELWVPGFNRRTFG